MNQKIIISTVLAALLAAGTVSAEGLLHLSWKPDYDAVKYDVTFSRKDHGKMADTWKTTAYMSDMLLPGIYKKYGTPAGAVLAGKAP